MINLKKLLRVAHYPEYCLLQWWRWTIPSRLVRKGVTLGKKVVFYGMPIVSLIPDSQIVIGSRSVIGGASVVVGDIPPGVIAAGNPARVIRAVPT